MNGAGSVRIEWGVREVEEEQGWRNIEGSTQQQIGFRSLEALGTMPLLKTTDRSLQEGMPRDD